MQMDNHEVIPCRLLHFVCYLHLMVQRYQFLLLALVPPLWFNSDVDTLDKHFGISRLLVLLTMLFDIKMTFVINPVKRFQKNVLGEYRILKYMSF